MSVCRLGFHKSKHCTVLRWHRGENIAEDSSIRLLEIFNSHTQLWHRGADIWFVLTMELQYDSYSDDLGNAWKTSNHSQKKCEFFKANSEMLGLDKADSCVSIGAGPGDVDFFLIKECMPNLKRYYAEEPDEAFRSRLVKTMGDPSISHVKVDVFSELADTWQGPGEKVDTVIALQCIMYVQERTRVFSRWADWLNPGGKLIVVTITGDSTASIIAKAMNPKSPLAIEESTIRSEMLASGMTDIQDDCFPMEGWHADGDKRFVPVILGREVTEEEVKAFYELRRKLCPGTNKMVTKNAVFTWTKPQVSE